MRLTDFLTKANEVHGGRYSYEQVTNPVKATGKVTILCQNHGYFHQQARYHLMGCGCPKCAGSGCRVTVDEFLKRCKESHGDRYGYERVTYLSSVNDKVTIRCPVHGYFQQSARTHMKGGGCIHCSGKAPYTLEHFLHLARECHGTKYDYGKVDLTGGLFSRVTIRCPKHGEFKQIAREHLKHGCQECAKEARGESLRVSFDDFVLRAKKVHGGKYSYLPDFRSLSDKTSIICPIHGVFKQLASNHVRLSNGCPECRSYTSAAERELAEFVSGLGLQVKKKKLGVYELDIYVESLNLAIEFNGLYWHSEVYKTPKYHLEKTELAERHGIHLIMVYEDDWRYKRDIVESRIKALVGKVERLYARKCKVMQVSSAPCRDFLNQNHIQGACVSKINLGLYSEGDLFAVCTFCGLRRNLGGRPKEGHWELTRYCSRLDTRVVGGFSKLLSAFVKEHSPKSILSYADRSWTYSRSPSMYDANGFVLEGITAPNYWYFKSTKRVNRFSMRKSVLVSRGFPEDMTEHQIANSLGYRRIYDSGNLRFRYDIA